MGEKHIQQEFVFQHFKKMPKYKLSTGDKQYNDLY